MTDRRFTIVEVVNFKETKGNIVQEKNWGDLPLWQKAAIVKIGPDSNWPVHRRLAGLERSSRKENQRQQRRVAGGALSQLRWSLGLLYAWPQAERLDGSRCAHVSDKVAIVTGANSGIGYETARVLAQRGATVIMACRNLEKAHRAAEQIRRLQPTGEVVVMRLDLADLDSVRAFAEAFLAEYDRLDLLINNAGIMVPPYGTTEQGFEQQFGVNHLGHFLLTALLIERLNSTPNARIISVSSIAHRFGTIDFDDLNWQRKEYKAMRAYGQSKLANLLFTYELQRRLAAAGHETIAVAAHPGYTATRLQGDKSSMRLMNRLLAQPQPMGALPTLYAATSDDVNGGDYIGPSGIAEIGGNPERVESNARSHDKGSAHQLWTVSEELADTHFDLAQSLTVSAN